MVAQSYVEIGRLIRARRDALAMTQDALASRVGLSRTSITNVERGRQAVYVHQLLLFAKALGVPPAELLPNRVEETKQPFDLSPELAALVDRLSSRAKVNL